MEVIHAIGRIYRITSPQTDQVYIGSTTQLLKERLAKHINSYELHLEGKAPYYTSFDIIKYRDAKIECIEEMELVSRTDLEAQEGKYIKQMENTVNKIIPGRTFREWVDDNREAYDKQRKQYYNENSESIIQRTKEYREKNIEKVKASQAQQYQRKKDMLNEKLLCECGEWYTAQHRKRHEQTLRHKKTIK